MDVKKNVEKKSIVVEHFSVLGLCVYPSTAASTRLRLSYLIPSVAGLGGVLEVRPFLNELGFDQWSRGGLFRMLAVLRAVPRLLHTLLLLPGYNVVIVQREALPFNTLFLERLAVLMSKPIVWDVDDALWEDSGRNRWIRGTPAKSRWLARKSEEVWAGNKAIERWAISEGSACVQFVPTTTSIPSINSLNPNSNRLAWIGTPATGPFIEALVWDLRDSLAEWVIDVVGAEIKSPPNLSINQYSWSPEVESDILSKAWIGLYPMDVNNPYVHGKSALKAILYGAYGIPTIATSTEATKTVIQNGETGFLCQNRDDWLAALHMLKDDNMRRELGGSAHKFIQEEYDPILWRTRMARRLENLLANRVRSGH